MFKTIFKDKQEFDSYVIEQKIRRDNGYLTVSERKKLEPMLEEHYKPTFIKAEVKKGLSIITDIKTLKKPCLPVEKGENISQVITDLKTTLIATGGLGLTANQIGYNKRISYIRIPEFKDKKLETKELILINAKIIEKDRPIKINNEQCLSFAGVAVTTKRFVFITIEYFNEKMELQTILCQDLESFVIQHEIDHQNGLTIFNRKWEA